MRCCPRSVARPPYLTMEPYDEVTWSVRRRSNRARARKRSIPPEDRELFKKAMSEIASRYPNRASRTTSRTPTERPRLVAGHYSSSFILAVRHRIADSDDEFLRLAGKGPPRRRSLRSSSESIAVGRVRARGHARRG